MNKVVEKPHLIFFITIPFIVLIGVLSGDTILDINVYDTYYVIAHLHLAVLISGLFGIIGCGYWIMQKAERKLSKWLNGIHIVLTIGGLIAVIGVPYIPFGPNTQSEFPISNGVVRQNLILTFTILLALFGQLIYIINLIAGMFRENKTND